MYFAQLINCISKLSVSNANARLLADLLNRQIAIYFKILVLHFSDYISFSDPLCLNNLVENEND